MAIKNVKDYYRLWTQYSFFQDKTGTCFLGTEIEKQNKKQKPL